MHVHQDADVGASHDVEDLAGDGLGEEGVIRRGDEHAFPGALQQHAALCPPDGDAGHRTFVVSFQAFQIIVSRWLFGGEPNDAFPLLVVLYHRLELLN